MSAIRVMYFCGGAANLIAAHRSWRASVQHPTEVSVTFSSQIQDACESAGCPTYMISVHPEPRRIEDGLFTIEHRPKKPAAGLAFHIEEFRYVLGLLATARKFQASLALVDSGTAHFFLFAIFRLFGIRVVPILHNTLWPTGFYPTRLPQRLLLGLDAVLFWRWAPSALISVSPECERQVRRLVADLDYPTLQIRAQFRPDYFASIPRPRFPTRGTFNVLFIGRVDRSKGVFDILKMARKANSTVPGRIKWRICGRGPDLAALTEMHQELGLETSVELMGWVSLEELQGIYADTHVCIVPTRSLFAEGLAMTAAEAVLAGRPLVSNPLVPATELLAPACMMAQSNDYESHADAVIELSRNQALYEQLCSACLGLGDEFLDPRQGLRAAVARILDDAQIAGR